MSVSYMYRSGGLMRCCLASLDDYMVKATETPKENDTCRCKYCSDEFGMIFVKGEWCWANPLFLPHTVKDGGGENG